jgi:parallel beta-helix repeat protein
LEGSSNNTVYGNVFTLNHGYGAHLLDGSHSNLFWNNEFIDNVDDNAYEEMASTGNSWSLADTGNYWSDCVTNPGYPNHYEIPGPGDGIDYHPECPLGCGSTITRNTVLQNDLLNCANGITIGADGITLDGNGHIIDGTDGGIGIYMDGKHNVTIKNCIIKEFNTGIYLFACSSDSVVNNITVRNNNYGIYLTSSSDNVLSNNIADSNYYGIILSNNSKHNMLFNNRANENGFRGIWLSSLCDSNSLVNNTVNNNIDGIRLETSSNYNTLTSNIADSNGSWYGISVYECSNDSLIGNTVRGTKEGGCGILLYGSSHCALVQNFIEGTLTGSGILLSVSDSNLISDNICVGNGYYGANLYNSHFNLFWNNEFIDNAIHNAYEWSGSNTNSWNLADTGNYWSDCFTNPGFPTSYIIPGPGDGVDYHPECRNSPPGLFSLLSPEDSAFVPTNIAFDWMDSPDPDAGDTVRYSLHISTSLGFHPDSTIIHDSLLVSNHSDTLNIGAYFWKVKGYDKLGVETWSTQTWSFQVFLRGDANGDRKISLADVIFLANYLLKGGPAPIPLESGDVNCDGKYNLVDVIKLARYVLLGEPFPC